jgi:hypothetical protein
MRLSVHACTSLSPEPRQSADSVRLTTNFQSLQSSVKIGGRLACTTMLLLAAVAFCVMPAGAQNSARPKIDLSEKLNLSTPAISKLASQGGPVLTARPAKAILDGAATPTGPFNAQQKLRLAIGLKPPHLAEEKALIADLLDKKSPNFHKFLTKSEWNARFAPSAADEQALVDWAKSEGLTVTQRYPSRLTIDVEGTADTIQKAFSININNYKAADNSSFFSNDRDVVLPANLASVVQSVAGLSSLQVMHPENKNMLEPAMPSYAPGPVFQTVAPAGGVTGVSSNGKKPSLNSNAPQIIGYSPTDLYSSEAYDFNALYSQGHCCNPFHTGGTSGSPVQTSIAIATAGTQQTSDFLGFHNQYPYLAMYWGNFTFVDGTPACCDGEGTMDFEWATAMSNSFGSLYDTSHVEMYDGVNANFSTFIDIFNKIANDSLARTMSTSWGCAELDCWDEADMLTVDNIFASMVGQGWTLVVASGDSGAVASCVAHDAVSFPASDPYVVAAGGSNLNLAAGPTYQSETGWSGGPDGCSSNDGGSTGGCSAVFAAPGYQTMGTPACGAGSRSVPDVALDADWFNAPETVYFNGIFWTDCQTQHFCGGGTSIVAPIMAGFFAQENAYGIALGNICGGSGTAACSPLGEANYPFYDIGDHGAPHYPFYDITSGCNNNDVTTAFGLGYYCASTGYDRVTGWGSINALQLAWDVNYWIQDYSAGATVAFAGPATGHWYNTDQTISWNVTAAGSVPAGVAGFTQGWDAIVADPTLEATPGSGNSFYSGPEFRNATSGFLMLSWAGQGCHTAKVESWDNTGIAGLSSYGSVCYDTIAPSTAASLSGTIVGVVYSSAVTVTLSASDSGSGLARTSYQLDGGALTTYTAPFSVPTTGTHTIVYFSQDVAGNQETSKSTTFIIKAHTATTLKSSLNPSKYGTAVTFTATVTPAFGGAPAGNVVFKDGATGLGTGTLNLSGVATFTTSTLAAGAYSITAVYGGSGKELGSNSAVLTQTVAKGATSSIVTSSINPSSFGQSVMFKATVKSSTTGTPVGTVTFKDGATNLSTVTLVAGAATFNTGALTVGSHTITALYNGSANYLTNTSPAIAQVVKKANTTTKLTSSLNPSTKGGAVTFTATIAPAFSGAPGGTVTFKDGATTLGTAAVNTTTKQATFKTATLSAATHSITAVYGGNASFNTSTSAVLKQVVNP